MSIPLLIANVLLLLAFLVHTIQGDKELHLLEPEEGINKREKWTMVRSGWHWISIDLLFATIIVAAVNFTSWFKYEQLIIQLLSIYFFAYGVVWLFIIFISKSFPKNYIKLGQWILLWGIATCLYFGL